MLKYLATIVATAIVVLFLLVSAVPLLHWFAAEGERAALDENRARWAERAIDSYRFRLDASCGRGADTARAWRVTVTNGSARAVIDAATSAPVSASERAGLPLDMPALFEAVEQALDAEADSLSVDYDADYGFPRRIDIDPDDGIDGDESSLRVAEFDPRPERA